MMCYIPYTLTTQFTETERCGGKAQTVHPVQSGSNVAWYFHPPPPTVKQ
jgi:hypothetical protein